MNLQEIEKRLSDIKEILNDESVENIDELEKEVNDLTEKRTALIEEAEKRQSTLDKIKNGEGTVIEKHEERKEENREMENILATKEYRSAFLKKLMGKELNEAELRAMTTAANSVGSAVPTTTLNMIEEKLRQTSALYPHVTVLSIPGYLTIPVEGTTNDASWVAEGSASTDVNDTLDSVSFSAWKLIRTIAITAEVSAMAIDAFEAYIVKKLADKMAIAIENAILNGTGTGQPKGILKETYNATNSVNYTKGGKPAYEDFAKLVGLLRAGYKPGAKFVVNSKTLWNDIATIVDGENRPLFVPNVNEGFAGRILGIPVIEGEYMADGQVLLGDFDKYTINFNKGIEIVTDTSADFRAGNVVYRSMALLDGKVVNTEAFVLLKESAS